MNSLSSHPSLDLEASDPELELLESLTGHVVLRDSNDSSIRVVAPPEPRRTWRILEGIAGFDELAPAWHQLLESTSSVEFYHLPEWISSLIPLIDESRLLFYVEELDCELSTIIPLIRANRTFAGISLQSMELLNNRYTPFTDYIVGVDQHACGLATRLAGALKASRIPWDMMYFPNVAAHSHVARDMKTSPQGMRVVQEKRSCHYFKAEDYAETLKRFSPNFRGNLRKARNKLTGLSDIQWEWNRDLPDLRRAFPEFLQVEASGWKWLEKTSILQNPEARGFYENLIEQFGPQGQCGINLLKQGGQVLAGQFALFQGAVCSLIKIGYDESFARFAPGNLLLEALLKKYQEGREVREINLISDRDWHQNWKPLASSVFNYFQFNFNSRALLAYSLYKGKHWTEQLRNSRKSQSNDNYSSVAQ